MDEKNEYLLDLFASQCMNGLISKGELPGYSVCHQAYSMAKMMLEVRSQYTQYHPSTDNTAAAEVMHVQV